MKYIFYDKKNSFYFRDGEKRVCKSDEVEIKTVILGLCGSDIHKFLDETPDKNYLLTSILGHEICGIVTNVGSNVSNVKVGDRVVVNPFNVPSDLNPCDSFSLCDKNIDIVGRNIDGGYSEVVYLPKNCIYKLPDSISSEDAIFIDDIAVALHGIHYAEKYKENIHNVAVIGDGPLGIICYRLLKLFYPRSKVILVSRNQKKLENLNIDSVSFFEIEHLQNKYDLVLEVVGGKQSNTINTAIKIANNNSLILCYGVYNFNYMANIDIRNILYKQGMLKGINSYCNKYNDFEKAIDILSSGKLIVKDLITNKINFNDSVEYIKNYRSIKNNIKTIFEVEK